jgi:hypothetical protein
MQSEIDKTITFSTDAATLAVFDPECLAERVNARCDWWCGLFAELEEVAEGKVAFISTATDGIFKARITSGDLFPHERDYARERLGPLGLEVKSGRVFIGKGELITGGDHAPEPGSVREGEGSFVEMPPGLYDLWFFSIEWFESSLWWNVNGNKPDDAPADLVIVLTPRTSAFKCLTTEPRLSGLENSFLFPSSTRQVGPAPGLLFTTEVWKSPSGLTLKPGGPCSYKPTLKDFSGLAWRDKISVRVLSVDHVSQTTIVELVEKFSS